MAGNSKGLHDFSQVDCYDIKMRGRTPCEFNIIPEANDTIDPANLRVKIGVHHATINTLILGNGITDNLDGTFKVSFTADKFDYSNTAKLEIFGLQDLPNKEIAIGNINYEKALS